MKAKTAVICSWTLWFSWKFVCGLLGWHPYCLNKSHSVSQSICQASKWVKGVNTWYQQTHDLKEECFFSICQSAAWQALNELAVEEIEEVKEEVYFPPRLVIFKCDEAILWTLKGEFLCCWSIARHAIMNNNRRFWETTHWTKLQISKCNNVASEFWKCSF